MGRAKEISLKVIPGKVANPFMRRHHYSGTVVNNSCLHFGVFLDGRLHGVMSYGPSLNIKCQDKMYKKYGIRMYINLLVECGFATGKIFLIL